MQKYQELLKSVGIADTRTFPIANAVDHLHDALSRLDNHNLERIFVMFPEMIEVVNAYAAESNCLRHFRDPRISKVE
jgi:hypothetical protein